MPKKLCGLFCIIFFLFFLDKSAVRAQTFGPICDTTTPEVTCAPTPTTRIGEPSATSIPTATVAPPVSGSGEITLILLGISGLFSLASFVSFNSFTKAR